MNTKNAKSKQERKEREVIEVTSASVSNVRVVTTKNGDDLVFFSVTINGVTVNNCRVATGKNGDFISWPQYKGSNDKYYNYVYCPLSDDDNNSIMELIQKAIDEG